MSKKIINLLEINQSEIIGTGNDPEILYKTDIDLQEYITYNNDELQIYNDVLNKYKNIFDKIKKIDNIEITDFKCGVLNANIPIRWDKNNIKKGYQIIEDNKINFIDCLQEKSIIKIDLITLDNNIFTEYSNNYYYMFNDFSTNPNQLNKKQIEISLLKDARDYRDEGRLYKSLKRLYAYYKIKNKKMKQNKLIPFFNSEIGKLSYLNNILIIIDFIISNNIKKLKKDEDILYNLHFINKYYNIQDLIDNYKQNNFNELLKNKIEDINKIINKETLQFIKDNNVKYI
jgi:hypothetical protein